MTSTPGKRTVRHRMELPLLVAREAERFQESALVTGRDFFGDQLADADHLIAVVRVGNEVAVVTKDVEHGETVRREATEPPGRLPAIKRVLPFEALVAERQRRAPHERKTVAGDELLRFGAIRVDLHVAR